MADGDGGLTGGPVTNLPNILPQGQGIMDIIGSLFPGAGGNGATGFGGINPNMIPFLTTALNQYNNSGKYMDLATKYADQMDPFGKQRSYYQDRLRQLTEDPNAYLQNSPDYKAALTQGLGALDSSLSAKGFAGAGHAADEAQRFGSTLAAQFLDKDRQSLMQMAGSQIGPAAAAGLISEGLRGSIDSQNQALANLFGAFTNPKQNPAGGGPGGGGGGGGGPLSTGIQKALDLAKNGGGDIGTFTTLFQAFKQGKIGLDQIPQYWRSYVQAGMNDANFETWLQQQAGQEAAVPGAGTGGADDPFGPSDPTPPGYGDVVVDDGNPAPDFTIPDYEINWDTIGDLGFFD